MSAPRDPARTADLPAPDPRLGAVVDGRWRIEGVLGEGGMGIVYSARHEVLDKRVALKVLRADLAGDRALGERFLQEARAASSIGHPNVVDIGDFGRLPDGTPWFAMEWLDGVPLGRALAEAGRLDLARICRIGGQIADGLAAAHAKGIVHRDLKPDNVFLVRRGAEADCVKILDFGIAKVGSATTKLTQAGTLFGTPHYMSPEQATGAAVDARSDVYALGVILFELATGRTPFDAETVMAVLSQHLYKAPPTLRDVAPEEPPPAGLEAIVRKAMAKSPDRRYATMHELAADLARVAGGEDPKALGELAASDEAPSLPADWFTPPRGKPKGRAPLAVAIVVLALGAAAAVRSRSDAPASASAPNSGEPSPPRDPPGVAANGERRAGGNGEGAAGPATTAVLFASDPLDAHVFDGERDLGAPPLTIDVPAGGSVALEVRKDGFRAERVTLDGSERRVTVKLVRAAAPATTVRATVNASNTAGPSPTAPPPTAAATAGPIATPTATAKSPPKPASTSVGGIDIVDPWAR